MDTAKKDKPRLRIQVYSYPSLTFRERFWIYRVIDTHDSDRALVTGTKSTQPLALEEAWMEYAKEINRYKYWSDGY